MRPAFGIGVALLAALLAAPEIARGQAAWEYSPYRVRIWLALEAVPHLPAQLEAPWRERIEARSRAVLGAVWDTDVTLAPPAARPEMLWRIESLDAERIASIAAEGVRSDKLYLVAVSHEPDGYSIRVRELDGRTRQMGPLVPRHVATLEAVPEAAWDAILESFTPLVRIERVEDKQITARVRAGGLIVDPGSPALIEPGQVLSPFLRRNDRSGEPVKNGIAPVAWTLLAVESRSDSLLSCRLHSGYRTAIPTRGGARLERLALLTRPRFPSTRLVLQSRTADARPLVGYDLYAKLPADADAEPELIGSTDAFGSLELTRGDGSIRLFYIKSGRQLLGRLPIVPGQAAELIVRLADDDSRLQAEGFVSALQSRALDLVARREILAARFRKTLAENKFSEAQTLLDEFRNLETQVDLRRSLDEAQQNIKSTDKLTQTRIDKLFTDARGLLNLKALSDELLNELNRELVAARSGQTAAGK